MAKAKQVLTSTQVDAVVAQPTDAAAVAAVKAITDNPTIKLTPEKKASKTATFTGTLTAFGILTIPVKTYKATDEDSINYNQIHSTCSCQLKQGKMHCPKCNVDVEKVDIVKGFNLGNEKAPNFLVVTQDELNAQKPASDKSMMLTAWVDQMDIDPVYYESTEFIAPDKGGEKPFALLLAGMQKTGKVAKGERVKGGRVQEFVVRPYGGKGLAVSYLRTDTEVRTFDKWTDVAVSPEEVELAATLIERYEADFTPANEDKYNHNVRRMLEAKSAGVAVTVPVKAADPTVTVDLLAALKASLAAAPIAKVKKVAVK